MRGEHAAMARTVVCFMRMGEAAPRWACDEQGFGRRERDWPDGALYMVVAADSWPEVQGPEVTPGRSWDDGTFRESDPDRLESAVAVGWNGALWIVEPGRWWRLRDYIGLQGVRR